MNANVKLFLVFLSCLTYCLAFSQSDTYEANELLIKWKAGSTATEQTTLRTQARVRTVRTFQNLSVELWEIADNQRLSISELVNKYSKHPAIDFVEPNYFYAASEVIPTDPKFGDQWNISNTGQTGGTKNADIGMTNAWDLQRESPNVKVAVIDTGIDWKHPDLVDNIWQNSGEDADGDGHVLEFINGQWVFDPGDENGIDDDGNGYIDDFIGWDFANDDNDPYDDHFHGTHVAGIVGAKGNDGVGMTGVTWDVQMAAVKFLSANRFGTSADAIAAVNYAVSTNMDISNASWGGAFRSQALRAAIQNAANQDHLVIAAAGNEGNDADNRPQYPAAFDLDNIISVANTDHKDALAITSNYGASSVDIAAPGTRILSCFPKESYTTISGTSMAAPHVAGACALLLGQHPTKTYSAIKNEVLNSVDKIAALNGKMVSGGRLNVHKLLVGSTTENVQRTTCGQQDSLALVDLYNATAGASWPTSWDLSQPMNTWAGVTTNARGCVVALDLYRRQLSGTLPASIGKLTGLQKLDLGRNELSGNIPTNISNLFNLRELSLSDNSLTGTIPAEVSRMTNLRTLSISKNQLTEGIPVGVEKLIKLQHLDLSDNQLVGTIPTNMDRLTQLEYLSLAFNELTGSIPVGIVKLGKLQYLDFSRNKLTGSIPANIGNLINLETIYLSDNELTGSIPTTIGNMKRLERLYLSTNQLSGSIPTTIGNLSRLEYLYFHTNQLTGSIPTTIGNLGNLQRLLLYTNQLTGSIPITIGKLKNLQQLGLLKNQLSGSIPTEMGNLNNLQALYLDNNSLTGCLPQNFLQFCEIDYNFNNNNLDGDFMSFCETRAGGCPCNRTADSLALVELYKATNGSNWTTKWDLNTPINTWHGITLNNNCVATINLSGNNLVGSIPASIAYLTALQSVQLQNNQLSGCFPESFSSLCAITYNFSGNANLPSGGDFASFCASGAGGCTTCDRSLDSLVLVQLYTATGGANWTTKWDLNRPINTWHGITLNDNGCITAINLYGNKLTGNIPAAIGQLRTLSSIVLDLNELTGSIPTTIGQLSNLQRLSLSLNQLTGNIPTTIGSLGKLQYLNLHANQLTSLPAEIGNLTKLLELAISSNKLTSLPTTIGNLGSLQKLLLHSNQITGLPTPIGNLSNLQELSLSYNQLTSLPTTIGNLENLQVLALTGNQLTSLPTTIGNLTNLQALLLIGNQLTSLPTAIGNLASLREFILTSNQLTSLPTELGNLDKLQMLDCSFNQLKDTIPTVLGNLTNLQLLKLNNNQLTGSIPTELGNLSNLQELLLQDNQLNSCFPKNFTTFCNTISSNFTNNPDLPAGGDFDAYCETSTGSCADLSFVWPGDFNNDGVVNNADVLYWGLAKSNRGPSRSSINVNWVAQGSPDWPQTVNGVNGKHQDGDGNGVVDAQDLQTIYANYGQTHATTLSAASFTKGVTYRLEPKGFQGEATFKYDLYVELDGAPIRTHGIAFTVLFNDSPVANATLDLTNSCLAPDEHSAIFSATSNALEVALTRTDKTDQLCNGLLGSLVVTLEDANTGEAMEIDVVQGSRVMANGTFNAIASTSLYDTYVEFVATSDDLLPAVYATHEECDKLGTARVTISGGLPPYRIEWSNGATTPTINNLVAGTYTVTIKDANNLTANYTIKIKKQFLPTYDKNGDLVNCNASETCAPTLDFTSTIPTGTHQVGNTITASGTIAANSDVTFKAGQSITLQPGFTAVAGSAFLATIEDCTTNTLQPSNNSNTFRVAPTSRSQEPLAIQIRPNPLRQQAVITYELPAAGSVQLIVSDMQGRPIRILLDGVIQEKGQQEVSFRANDLAKGIYLLSLKTAQQIATKKMVLLE